MVPMTINWGEAGLLAGRSFGTVFLILIILAVVTWLVGLAFQGVNKRQGKAKLTAKAETAKTKT